MDWTSVITSGIVALVVATGPVIILFVLQRRGANKKLEIDEAAVNTTVFAEQREAFQSLYNTSQEQLAQAEKKLAAANQTAADLATELKRYQEERETLMAKVDEQGRKIEKLEQADHDKSDELADARKKVEQLRSLFTQILQRTGIQMTPEEQAIFDDTKPRWVINEELRGGSSAQ